MTRSREPHGKHPPAAVRGALAALPVLFLLCTSLPAAPPPQRVPLVFGAASLTDALREAADRFRLEGGGDVRFHLGASEALATQIVAGAPADLFISASPNAMNRVQQQGLVVPGTRRDLLRNRLVVVAPRDRARPLRDLIDMADARFARIALADPATAPAGRYANESLVRSGVWDTIAPRIVPAADVRAALAYVATGEADLGVVYATDARVEPRVGIVLQIPDDLHSPILYPAALMRRAAFLEPARQFLRFLSEPEGLAILARAGFTPTVDLPAAAEEKAGAERPAAGRAAPAWLAPVLISLRVAALSVVLALPFALLFARLLARRRFPGRLLLETLLNLPLVLPPVATGYALLLLLSRDGPLGPMWRSTGISFVFSWTGAAIAAAVIAFPLMLRAAQVAFESIDPRLPSLARTLGASRLRAFRTVTLPLAFPGVLAAALIGFARALGEFGATMMVAGNIPGATQTLPLAIFTAVQVGSGRAALVLCALSALLALGTLAAARLIEQLRRDRRGS